MKHDELKQVSRDLNEILHLIDLIKQTVDFFGTPVEKKELHTNLHMAERDIDKLYSIYVDKIYLSKWNTTIIGQEQMDKKIKKIEKETKKTSKDLKGLEKADKKRDKVCDLGKMVMKNRKMKAKSKAKKK